MKFIAISFLAILLFNSASARDLNCDPTALTYDVEECISRSASTKKVSYKSNANFDAASSYNKKFQKLDAAKKVRVNSNNNYGIYLATSPDKSISTAKNTVRKSSKSNKKSIKKGFNQVGIGAKIPLKPRNDF